MKFNKVSFYGIARQAPRIVKDEDTGEYKRGMFPLAVIKNTRYTGDKSSLLTKNVPVIMTKDPKKIQLMESIEEFDSVQVKGVIVTEPVMKNSFCSECGAKQQKQGVIVYIAPIFLDVVKKNGDVKTAADDLQDHMEISNEITVVGNLCADPERVAAAVKTPICQYQLAVRRTFRLDSNYDTDYPYIKSFEDNAKQDLKYLRKGSKVMVDGCIQSRKILRTAVCECCGKNYSWEDAAMEIVTYETEYLGNFASDEDEDLANAEE